MIASLSFLCQRWHISKPTLITFLRLLEADKMIERSLYHNISLLTICNYESYQTSEASEVDNLIDHPLDNPQGGGKVDNLKTDVTHSESMSSSGKEESHVDNLFDHLFDHPLDTRKENILYNDTKYACVRETKLFESMRGNQAWQEEAICMRFHISREECLRRIDEFELDCRCQNKVHADLRDIYQHFSNWLRIQVDKSKKDEETRKQSQNKRRGSEANATSAKDYTTSF